MLHEIPNHYYVAYLKEAISVSYSAPGVLADAAHKTGRRKDDFELREISREVFRTSERVL
jgi:hypothetical protein